jgi:PilZ domain
MGLRQFILSSRTITTIFNFNLSKDAVKTAVQQIATQTICLKYTGGPLIERRRAKRFQVDWQIRVEITGDRGSARVETGALRNISSSGALLSLTTPLSKGTKLAVYIKLPLEGKKWMKYPARVVRIEQGAAVSAAIKFDSARPNFGRPLSAS